MRSLILGVMGAAFAFGATTDIKVDQVGYLPGAPKFAAVVSKVRVPRFVVRNAADASIAFQGELSAPVDDPDSGDRVQLADFTKLDKSGEYYLEAPGVGESWKFAIAPDVYRRAYYLAMRSYYGQRCGTVVDLGPEFPGYRHEPCHLSGAYHASSGKNGPKSTGGGWHDAGDYGRYVVNSGITTGTLLWSYELFGAAVRDIGLNIPESGKGTPDILSEIRWNLDWMLSMQDSDGGVWHKQTSERFCGFVMPEKDTLIGYVIGTGSDPYKSSCATADLAAVAAIAARVFKPFDASYSDKCLRAARAAWAWVDKNPNVLFRNPAGVSTGEYGDRDCSDERLWAAAELWRTTSDDSYQRYFLANYENFRSTIRADGLPSWANVGALGLWSYALGRGGDAKVAAAIRQDSVNAAQQIVERTAHHPYRISMTTKDYIWGSNSVAANYGMQLLVANAIAPDERYVQTALEDLHYILGRNPFSLSWVTRVGANPFRHPHHRPSGADANPEPWPGLMSGGPNARRQDPAMKSLPDLPPARMYLDEQASYATNEVAINWNAPLVFVLAGAMAQRNAH